MSKFCDLIQVTDMSECLHSGTHDTRMIHVYHESTCMRDKDIMIDDDLRNAPCEASERSPPAIASP